MCCCSGGDGAAEVEVAEATTAAAAVAANCCCCDCGVPPRYGVVKRTKRGSVAPTHEAQGASVGQRQLRGLVPHRPDPTRPKPSKLNLGI